MQRGALGLSPPNSVPPAHLFLGAFVGLILLQLVHGGQLLGAEQFLLGVLRLSKHVLADKAVAGLAVLRRLLLPGSLLLLGIALSGERICLNILEVFRKAGRFGHQGLHFICLLSLAQPSGVNQTKVRLQTGVGF